MELWKSVFKMLYHSSEKFDKLVTNVSISKLLIRIRNMVVQNVSMILTRHQQLLNSPSLVDLGKSSTDESRNKLAANHQFVIKIKRRRKNKKINK